MTFVPVKLGEWKLRYFKKTASTAFANKSLVDWPASPTGYFVAATSSTTKLCGIIQKTVASGDSDYASNTLEPVLVPLHATAEVYATAVSAAETDVGTRVDLTDASTVNDNASSVGRFVITGYISATLIKGYLLPVAQTGAA